MWRPVYSRPSPQAVLKAASDRSEPSVMRPAELLPRELTAFPGRSSPEQSETPGRVPSGSADPDRMGLSPSQGVWSAVCWILLSLCSFIYQKQTDNASRAAARTVKGNTAQSPEPARGASVWAVGFMNPGQKVSVWGFPGGLVVRNPRSQCRSCGLNPWSEN